MSTCPYSQDLRRIPGRKFSAAEIITKRLKLQRPIDEGLVSSSTSVTQLLSTKSVFIFSKIKSPMSTRIECYYNNLKVNFKTIIETEYGKNSQTSLTEVLRQGCI